MTVLVTGGSGFIGSNFILNWFLNDNERIINLDKLTYAGNNGNLKNLSGHENYIFIHGDINDCSLVQSILERYQVRGIINFAAESHVDRSISDPHIFINTNVIGTFNLLQATYLYWKNLSKIDQEALRFIQVSTDEVFGSLKSNSSPFTENSRFEPNSPYSASKASADHFVRAFNKTYGLPVITTHCSNNYGPYQFIEKLIPLSINKALKGSNIPLYGNGMQIRDWLYVEDHCSALKEILKRGQVGTTYSIGGNNEKTNLEVVTEICKILDVIKPRKDNNSYSKQITFVKDRPGHDIRYAIDSSKLKNELNWLPLNSFEEGISKTVSWYVKNDIWIRNIEKSQLDSEPNKYNLTEIH